MSKIFTRLCEQRGITPDFLSPQYSRLSDPFILPDMDQAVRRIQAAIQASERILIYGDYDVDGVTSSTLMEEALKLAGVAPDHITIMLPDRFADGYGMSPKLITRAKTQGTTLVITVDCGSRNHAIIDELNHEHIDTIVTDHHETEATLPAALAVINPHREDHPTKELQHLAGVGVAFKLAQALVSRGLIPSGQEKWLLDLVLLGTICDSMLLIGENRILCYYGLKVLAKARRPGLVELMRRAGVKSLSSESIGFQLGPRLNAAGRLDTAELSLNLLRATTPLDAAPLVEKLEQLNKKRKAEQLAATSEIKRRGVGDTPVIIETGQWHEGIIGIVAGRLVEEYHKPAFVLTETEGGIYKGSGRSFGDFNLAEALAHVQDAIIGGGGHAAAAGVKVRQEDLYQFRERLNAYYESLHLPDQSHYFTKHADLDLTDFSDLGLSLLDELKTLEPFGPGNEEPIFRLVGADLVNVTRMGAERSHLRLDFRDSSGRQLKSVAFFAPEPWLTLDPQLDHVTPLVKLTENDYNGVKSCESHLIDLTFRD